MTPDIGRILSVFAACAIVVSCSNPKKVQQSFLTDPYHYNITKRSTGTKGAVVSAHPLASQVGTAILKKGGNAFDAAIATQLALAVVYPGAGNIGGGGFMVGYTSAGESVTLDYREKAPSAASRDMYLDSAGNLVPGKSYNGHLSCGVPGTVAGIFETYKYARLPFHDLIQPAIDLARSGFAITAGEARSLNRLKPELRLYNMRTTPFEKEAQWRANDTLIQTDLANTLTLIRDKGPAGFYEGRTAQLIVEEMKRGGGLISAADLKNYKAIRRVAHEFDYHGYHLVTMALPSSGGILIHQMLKMVEHRPLDSFGFLSPAAVQLMTEAERRAYADRASYMGDPDFYKAPVNKLTDSVYLVKRMADFIPGVAGKSQDIPAGETLWKESKETTHFSVIDSAGNAVSVTTTLNNGYGSKTVVAGAGFLMNDEMDDFSSKPGAPNLYGAVGGEANAIAPNKRMLSSMTPTIVLKSGKPFLVLGTPGGTTIPTSVFQTIVDILDFRLSVTEAVNGPKFHHQWIPDQIEVERKIPDLTKSALIKMGYKLHDQSEIGRTEVIKITEQGLEAVGDIRGDDSADAY
jgi:gamma-glutamyltranspeptidase / glutathione hydrolase